MQRKRVERVGFEQYISLSLALILDKRQISLRKVLRCRGFKSHPVHLFLHWNYGIKLSVLANFNF
jgi:hypothetical protein